MEICFLIACFGDFFVEILLYKGKDAFASTQMILSFFFFLFINLIVIRKGKIIVKGSSGI